MKIHELTLFTTSLDDQNAFYCDQLGFEGQLNEDELRIQAGSTTLIFKERDEAPYYHFAFLIPVGHLEEAISFAESKNIELLKHNEKQIIDFGTGTAIYFKDPAGNIVEFIDRPSLNKQSNQPFSLEELICINEIGLPASMPQKEADKLIADYGIAPLNRANFSDDFCWCGDLEGTFIVVKEGRNWLPTSLPAVLNDFDIVLETQTGIHQASFRFN